MFFFFFISLDVQIKKFIFFFKKKDSGSSIEAYHSPFSLCFKKEGAKLYKVPLYLDYIVYTCR